MGPLDNVTEQEEAVSDKKTFMREDFLIMSIGTSSFPPLFSSVLSLNSGTASRFKRGQDLLLEDERPEGEQRTKKSPGHNTGRPAVTEPHPESRQTEQDKEESVKRTDPADKNRHMPEILQRHSHEKQ